MASEAFENDIGNPRLERIVSAAKELFYRYGIKRVTVEEICERAEISKMTFYKFFTNKLELVKYLLNRIIDEAEAAFNALVDSDLPFEQKVQRIIEMKMAGMTDMSSEFMLDIYRGDMPEVSELMQQRIQQSRVKVMDFLRSAQEAGRIRPDIRLEFHLYIMDKLTEMAIDPKLTVFYESPAAVVKELVNLYFYGILQR